MEVYDSKNSVYKSAAHSGLILGLAIIVLSILIRVLGFSEGALTFLIYQIFMAVGIAFGIKKYKEEQEGAFISYAKALGLGLLIALFSGLIQAFFVYIYYRYISPEEMGALVNSMQEVLMNMGKSDDEVEMASSIISPSYFGFVILLKEAFKGLIFSLVIAAFLKKEKGIFEE